MVTEVVTIEYFYNRRKEVTDLVTAVAEHIKVNQQGQAVEIVRNLSGVGNQLHLLLRYASISEYETKRQAPQADPNFQKLMAAIAEHISRSSHHFYETVWTTNTA